MQVAGNIILAALMDHSVQLWLETQRYWFRIPAGSVCHHGCAYTVLQTVQMPWVRNVVYGTVNYKEPWIVLTSGFLLSRYRHDCAKSDVKQYSLCWRYSFNCMASGLGLQHSDTVTMLAVRHFPRNKKYRQIKSCKTNVVDSTLYWL